MFLVRVTSTLNLLFETRTTASLFLSNFTNVCLVHVCMLCMTIILISSCECLDLQIYQHSCVVIKVLFSLLQYGFNLVFAHKQAINCIALSLNHRSLRTKALVLELLAAVCLVSGGHEIILNAFDNFKECCNEKYRFETLMHYFKNYEEFHIDFMVGNSTMYFNKDALKPSSKINHF